MKKLPGLGIAWLVCLHLFGQSPFAFRDVGGVSLELSEGGKPVFLYNYGMILKPGAEENMRRSTYLHPVYAPDGTVITDDFNPNHIHHRGISWMWPVVVVEGKTYDLWTLGEIRQRFVRWISRETKSDGAILAVENGWYVGERKIVKEDVEIHVHPVAENTRRLDFRLELEPVEAPVELGGMTEEKKGYGGLCFRFAPADGGARKTTIRTDKRAMPKDGVLEPASWAEVEAEFGGKRERIRIEDDPSNPGYPNNGWLLRHSFPFLNVSYPGLSRITLVKGKPLVLKYHFALYSRDAARAR
jgi:hypothetical protein